MPLKGFEVGEQRHLQSLGVFPATAARTPPARRPSAIHPRLRRSTRRAYSPECVEGVFSEVRTQLALEAIGLVLRQPFFDREHDSFRQHELGRRRCQPRNQFRNSFRREYPCW